MRQVTQNVSNAFANNRAFKSGNDEVKASENTVDLLLHGNLIAWKIGGKTFITNSGYQTNVTKDRLNGIKGVSIHQKNGNIIEIK